MEYRDYENNFYVNVATNTSYTWLTIMDNYKTMLSDTRMIYSIILKYKRKSVFTTNGFCSYIHVLLKRRDIFTTDALKYHRIDCVKFAEDIHSVTWKSIASDHMRRSLTCYLIY